MKPQPGDKLYVHEHGPLEFVDLPTYNARIRLNMRQIFLRAHLPFTTIELWAGIYGLMLYPSKDITAAQMIASMTTEADLRSVMRELVTEQGERLLSEEGYRPDRGDCRYYHEVQREIEKYELHLNLIAPGPSSDKYEYRGKVPQTFQHDAIYSMKYLEDMMEYIMQWHMGAVRLKENRLMGCIWEKSSTQPPTEEVRAKWWANYNAYVRTKEVLETEGLGGVAKSLPYNKGKGVFPI